MSKKADGTFPEGPPPGFRHDTFLDDPVQDHLLRALLTLAMELSVTREHLSALQSLVVEKGVIADDDMLLFKPSETMEKKMAADRARLLDDLLGPLLASVRKS